MTTSVYADLQGRSVLVSGGATGIGSTLVEHFAQQSARVALVDIAVEAGHALADRLTAEGLAATFFVRVGVNLKHHCLLPGRLLR